MRYIELNPVRANMIQHPGDYRWSSYAYNAHGQNDRLITPHPVYEQLGNTPGQRQYSYRELFNGNLDSGSLHAIRDALNQELVLGRDDFKDKIEKMTLRAARRGKDGRPRIEETRGAYYVV